jgi:flagellar biosynthesis component FlhA
VLTTHLTEVVRENMAELLSYTETQKLLDELPREQQKLVSGLIPSQITLGGAQRVLRRCWPSRCRSATWRRSWRESRRPVPGRTG